MAAVSSFFIFGAGSALAKYILKNWIGSDFVGEFTDELVDLVREEAELGATDASNVNNTDQFAVAMANRMRIVHDLSKLPDNSKRSIAIEVATALTKVNSDIEYVLDHRMDSSRLAKAIINEHSLSSEIFTIDEIELYKKLIAEAANAQVQVSGLLKSFSGDFAAKLLKDNELLISLVKTILKEPSEAIHEFEQRYKKLVKNKLDRLEVFGLPELNRYTSKQSLSIAYISLDVENQNLDSVINNFNFAEILKNSTNFRVDDLALNLVSTSEILKKTTSELVIKYDTHAESKNFYTPLDFISSKDHFSHRSNSIESLLSKKRRVVIQGQAGSGKTTLLQWLAVRSASGDFQELLNEWNQSIPFYIRLRDYVDTGFPLPQQFPEKIAPAFSGVMPSGWVHDVLEAGLALVLIDGVDELPFDQRNEMLSNLDDLVETYPASRYVVSSRPAALKEQLWPEWSQWIIKEGFTTTTLRDMDSVLVGTFIDQWHEALANTVQDPEEKYLINTHATNLKGLLSGRPPLRRLAKNPLLCAMICALHQERQQNLPSDRLKLYEECVEMLLTRRDEGRRIATDHDYPSLTLSQGLSLIQNLSYWMISNGYSDIENNIAEKRFDKILPSLDIMQTTGEQVIKFFCERTSLLREPIIGRIDFAHLTFQEYLAAKEAVEEGDFGVLIKHAEDDTWREVIVLAVGIARKKERELVLDSLLKKSRRQNISRAKRKQIALLALACLETSVSLDPNLRDEILSNASSSIPPSDNDDAKLIASAGDPAVSLLYPKDSYDNAQMVYCIRTLALIGTEKAMAQLVAFADYENPILQRALNSAWDNFDPDKFASTVLKNVNTVYINKGVHLQKLHHLRQLSFLHIEKYSSIDGSLSVINKLSQLESLSISFDGNVQDISPLISVDSLRNLDIKFDSRLSDEVIDFEQFGKIMQLSRLSIAGGIISSPSIKPLTNIKNLSELSLSTFRGEIPDFRVLKSLRLLKRLSISTYKTTLDLSVFSDLVQIEMLTIKSRIVPQSIDKLVKLENLVELSIPIHSDYSDLSFLNELSKLDKLSLDLPEKIDLGPISSLTSLKSLKIKSRQEIDFDFTLSLKKLAHLDLTECNINDITPLVQLESLKQLRLSSANEVDLSVLEELENIEIIIDTPSWYTHTLSAVA